MSKYLFGPVPSRRMGVSLGISPIPEGTCNYSCVYCQLGRTKNMTNTREMFFSVNEIINELKMWFKENQNKIDIITIVGEGEPTLFLGLGKLIDNIKEITNIPIAVITNGALLSDKQVRKDLMKANIVLPSFDASNISEFKKINRPIGKIEWHSVYEGLKLFSKEYKGKLWIEFMLVNDYNSSKESIDRMNNLLKEIDYDKIYINTPVRPPAEKYIKEPNNKAIEYAIKILKGIAINHLTNTEFLSDIKDDNDAILSIIKRHPMNQHEIISFLKSRNCENFENVLNKLDSNSNIERIEYKGYLTYRIIN